MAQKGPYWRINLSDLCIIIYSRFGSRLLAAPFPRSPPARGGLPVLARPRLGLGARGLRRGARANSVVVVVVVVVIVTHFHARPPGACDWRRYLLPPLFRMYLIYVRESVLQSVLQSVLSMTDHSDGVDDSDGVGRVRGWRGRCRRR